MIYEQRRKPEYWEYMTAITNVLPLEEYVDTWVAEQSMEFLGYPGPKPFFLWCGFCGPHAPIDPPEPYDRMYPFDEMPLPKSRSDNPPRSPKGKPAAWWGDDTAKIRRWRSYYYGLTTLIDDMLGKIMALLDRRGLWENTLVILTSDHGDMAGDYNLMEKGNFYEEVIHVPLLVVPPGSGRAQPTVSGLVEVSDIAPTILDYAGVPIPPQMAHAMSLRGLVEGGGEAREAILCEHLVKKGQPSACIRTERFKYIFSGLAKPPEFYDLQEDPGRAGQSVWRPALRRRDRPAQGPAAGPHGAVRGPLPPRRDALGGRPAHLDVSRAVDGRADRASQIWPRRDDRMSAIPIEDRIQRYEIWRRRLPTDRPMIGFAWEPEVPPLPEMMARVAVGQEFSPDDLDPGRPPAPSGGMVSGGQPAAQRDDPVLRTGPRHALGGGHGRLPGGRLSRLAVGRGLCQGLWTTRAPVRFDPDNPWLRKAAELTRVMVDHSAGRYPGLPAPDARPAGHPGGHADARPDVPGHGGPARGGAPHPG